MADDSHHEGVDDAAIARSVVEALRTVPGVADASSGSFAEAATHGQGERVRGVVVRRVAGALELEVHVTAVYAPAMALPELANQVRGAALRSIESLSAGPVRCVDVTIDDLRIEGAHS